MLALLSPCALAALTLFGAAVIAPAHSRPLAAQPVPVIETMISLDSARRITVITPALVSRLGLASPAWPVVGAFREARLYRVDDGTYVLVVQRIDSTLVRYALDAAAVASLLQAVRVGLLAQGRGGDRLLGTGTGVVVSQPAGNMFVRNQTFLGLVAYGPATAALLAKSSGAAAAGGYFLAAGTSFFVSANMVQGRVVTRAQAQRAAHGGTRGALAGVGIAAIVNANGGPGWGAPILAGALGGTIVGFQQARGLSDGEAASSGFFADLGALTALGIGGTSGAFKGRKTVVIYQGGSYTNTDNSLRGPGKAAVGAALGAGIIGYVVGPRYAQRAAYNVTAGDVSVAFTSAVLGGFAASSLIGDREDDTPKYGVATAGVLAGAFLADRGLVRRADRTSADGTLVQLGAIAGALMGGGIAVIAKTESQGTLALASVGGLLGLLAADGIIQPARDAGPLRGIMQSSSRALDGRVFVSLGPVTSVRVTF